MKPPIANGTILLTGASAGIGDALARQLAHRAKCLILVARRRERLEALGEELVAANPKLKVVVKPCDLIDLTAVDTMLTELEEEVGVIDVLINNAGFGDVSVFEFASWDKLQRMIQLNISSLTYLTHRVTGPMVAQGRGGILNISSGFGLMFMPGFASYVGTKHYVTGFTESLRLELASQGVVVSQVCPGPVDTEFESVAGNPVGQSPPAFMTLTAEECAAASLSGFSRGKALIIPGFAMKLISWMTMATPRFLVRFFLGIGGKMLYRQQRKQLDASQK